MTLAPGDTFALDDIGHVWVVAVRSLPAEVVVLCLVRGEMRMSLAEFYRRVKAAPAPMTTDTAPA